MEPTYAEIAECCEDTFTARSGAGSSIDLVLVQTHDGTYPRFSPGGTLVFRGPADPALEQGTVQMSHPDLGEFPIFVVPVGEDERGREYEAVFS